MPEPPQAKNASISTLRKAFTEVHSNEKSRDLPSVDHDTVGMANHRPTLLTSWGRTRTHLATARSYLTGEHEADLTTFQEYLDHNELELAFDCLVDIGGERHLPLSFWQDLDRAAREMRLYTAALGAPHLTTADLCRRHLAAASEND